MQEPLNPHIFSLNSEEFELRANNCAEHLTDALLCYCDNFSEDPTIIPLIMELFNKEGLILTPDFIDGSYNTDAFLLSSMEDAFSKKVLLDLLDTLNSRVKRDNSYRVSDYADGLDGSFTCSIISVPTTESFTKIHQIERYILKECLKRGSEHLNRIISTDLNIPSIILTIKKKENGYIIEKIVFTKTKAHVDQDKEGKLIEFRQNRPNCL